MTNKQNRYSETAKVKALKQHLLEGVAVSEVCDRIGVAPSVFYKWQQKLFSNAGAALNEPRKSKNPVLEGGKIKRLEERLQQREEALAELMIEHVALKKKSIGLV